MRLTRLALFVVAGLWWATPSAATVTARAATSEFGGSQTGNKLMAEPTGCVNGDAEVFIAASDKGHSLASPAGWTVAYSGSTTGAGADMDFAAGWIVPRSGAPNLTWTFSGTGYLEIEIICLTSSTGTVATDSQSAAGGTNLAVSSADPPATTAVATASLAIAGVVLFGSSGSLVASSGYTNVTSLGSGGSRDNLLESKALSASGSEDPGVVTTTVGSGSEWDGFTATFKDGAAASACSRSLLGVGC